MVIEISVSIKFDSSAIQTADKFQNVWKILITNLVTSRIYEILRQHVFSDIEMCPLSPPPPPEIINKRASKITLGPFANMD